VGARARLLQPAGPRLGRGMDSDLGAAIPMREVRPHDELFAGLAASVAVVCGGGNYGSALPAFDSERDGARHRSPLWGQFG